jgi:hypothetical protein
MSSRQRANLWGPLRIRISRLLPALLLLPGCRLFDFDSCLYELRGVSVEGRVNDGSAEILYAYVSVSEQRDYQPDKDMSWRLNSASLKDHVTSMTLRDSNNESQSLYVFPASNFQNDISSGAVRQSDGANLNGIFDALFNGRGVIDVRTDIPGREQVRFVPPILSQQDWYRPKCG